jgi:hypothetical protein
MNEAKKIFEEAAKEALSEKEAEFVVPVVENTEAEIEEARQRALALELTEAGVNQWSVLSKRLTGDYAERFMREIDALPGREFIKVYMKMLEYVKPKVVRRTQEEQEEEDDVIQVEIYNRTIDIEHESQD